MRSAQGRILGAGIFIGTDAVLTCAHVISPGGPPPADTTVLVDFVGLHGSEPVPARVADNGWVPGPREGFGDLALLRLRPGPPPGARSAPLHRLAPLADRRVRMYGFPEGRDDGVWYRATTVGPHGEWMQLAPSQNTETVRPGFSGAGVTTPGAEYVIGMVVSRYVEPQGTDDRDRPQRFHAEYMIPIETAVRYLPRIGPWVGGDKAVDDTLIARPAEPSGAPADPRFDAQLTRWFRRDPALPAVWSVVITHSDTGRATALRRALTLADRELTTLGPHETAPPLGSFDLAVDVAGRTVDEVARRIADRLGLGADGDQSAVSRIRAAAVPLTAVLEGVDSAGEPLALMEFLRVLAERGSRLLLVFRRPDSAAERRARELSGPGPERIGARLARLAERLELLAGRERRAHRLAVLFPAVRQDRPAPERAGPLRMQLTRLRADPDLGSPPFLPRLTAAERAVESALGLAETCLGAFGDRGTRHDELSGLLEASRHRLADQGRAEDPGAAALYRAAHTLLHTPPCELAAAAEAVDRFVRAVRDARDARGSGDARDVPSTDRGRGHAPGARSKEGDR